MAKTDQELAQEEVNNRQYMYGGTGPFSQFLSGERREILRPEFTQVAGFAAGPSGVEYITETIPGKYGPAEYDPSYSPVRRGLSTLSDYFNDTGEFLGDVFFGDATEQAEAVSEFTSSLRDMVSGGASAAGNYVTEQARAAASGGEYFDPETRQITEFDPTIVMGGGSSGGGPALASGFRRSGNEIGDTLLYSGGGRQGTAIAAGSALRNELERISPGNFDYDLGFGVRAKERDQINQTEFRYSSNQMGEPKEISIFDLEGRPFVTTQSDRTDVGKSLTGIGDVDFDIPVDLLGGQGFMFRNPGELWASGNTVTPKIYEPAMLAKKNFALGGTLEDPLLLPYRMGAKGSDFSHMTTDTMLTYARNTMSPKTIKEANKQIKTFFPEFKGIENPESMRQLSRQPDPIRGKIRDIFDMKFRYDGALDLPSTRLAITDPKQYSALLGGLQNVGQFDLSQELFRGTHPSYPSTVPGQGLGQLKEKDISIFELMPDYVQYRGPVRTAQGKKGKEYQRGLDPTFTSTPVQTEMYGLQTGVRGAPGQQDPNKAQQFTGVITEDILRGIEARRAQ